MSLSESLKVNPVEKYPEKLIWQTITQDGSVSKPYINGNRPVISFNMAKKPGKSLFNRFTQNIRKVSRDVLSV